jgi:hypothetical protein
MANAKTAFGATFDTFTGTLELEMHAEALVVSEIGGSNANVVTITSDSVTLTKVAVLAGDSHVIPLNGLKLGTVGCTETGTGTPYVTIIKKSR